MAGWIA
jgi:hypothetical protein